MSCELSKKTKKKQNKISTSCATVETGILRIKYKAQGDDVTSDLSSVISDFLVAASSVSLSVFFLS